MTISTTVLRTQAGWYAGDFHTHTTASDGKNSPAALLDMARRTGLDFLAITDHNTNSGWASLPVSAALLVIPGMEVTLDTGHFNVFGLEEVPPWLPVLQHVGFAHAQGYERLSTEVDTAAIIQQCHDSGCLVSLNHPLLEPWAWQQEELPLSSLHCLEIWNDPTWPTNETANPATVAMWTQWLNAGYRITAIGGSDYHYSTTSNRSYRPALGLPRTYVYAEQLSATAIYAGVRQHQVYVSMEPQITVEAFCHGYAYAIGSDMGEQRGKCQLQARTHSQFPAIELQLLKNGEVVASRRGQRGLELNFADTLRDDPVWYRCDVRDGEGRILAVSNPIFGGRWPTPPACTYGSFLA